MGLFDWFRKPKPTVPLPQLSYDVAYFILPDYAYHGLEQLTDLCLKSPAAAGPFLYFTACRMRQVEPDILDGKRFHWHHGLLDDAREYFALEYPTPPPVDMSNVPLEQVASGDSPFVLAPYYSAILRDRASAEVSYFVLGQAPMGGGTTLRSVLREGMNCNLGSGPEPRFAAFLDAIRERLAKRT
jgi:hypothetical protein